MRLVQLTFFTAALLLVSKTTPSYKPLELYQHNVMIDKPQKDVSLLDEALANVDKYPRMETHTEDLQCYSYLECYRLGLDFIATNEMFLLMQNFGFSAEELMVSVIYTTNMYYEFNKRIRAVAANPNLDHTDTGMNGYRVFYHRLLDALGKIEETQMSSKKTLYRGLRSKRSLNITKGYFNTFMSASESLEEAQKFAGPNGSILYISSELGASIELFSIAPNEKEILFRPNILFAVDIVNSTNDKIFLVTLLENSASLSHSPVTFVVLLLNVKNLW